MIPRSRGNLIETIGRAKAQGPKSDAMTSLLLNKYRHSIFLKEEIVPIMFNKITHLEKRGHQIGRSSWRAVFTKLSACKNATDELVKLREVTTKQGVVQDNLCDCHVLFHLAMDDRWDEVSKLYHKEMILFLNEESAMNLRLPFTALKRAGEREKAARYWDSCAGNHLQIIAPRLTVCDSVDEAKELLKSERNLQFANDGKTISALMGMTLKNNDWEKGIIECISVMENFKKEGGLVTSWHWDILARWYARLDRHHLCRHLLDNHCSTPEVLKNLLKGCAEAGTEKSTTLAHAMFNNYLDKGSRLTHPITADHLIYLQRCHLKINDADGVFSCMQMCEKYEINPPSWMLRQQYDSDSSKVSDDDIEKIIKGLSHQYPDKAWNIWKSIQSPTVRQHMTALSVLSQQCVDLRGCGAKPTDSLIKKLVCDAYDVFGKANRISQPRRSTSNLVHSFMKFLVVAGDESAVYRVYNKYQPRAPDVLDTLNRLKYQQGSHILGVDKYRKWTIPTIDDNRRRKFVP